VIHAITESKKQSHNTPMEAQGGKGCIAPTHSQRRHWMGEWSGSLPGRSLSPGKWPVVPIVQEAGWASEPVWT
jgi:hypothetical protein